MCDYKNDISSLLTWKKKQKNITYMKLKDPDKQEYLYCVPPCTSAQIGVMFLLCSTQCVALTFAHYNNKQLVWDIQKTNCVMYHTCCVRKAVNPLTAGNKNCNPYITKNCDNPKSPNTALYHPKNCIYIVAHYPKNLQIWPLEIKSKTLYIPDVVKPQKYCLLFTECRSRVLVIYNNVSVWITEYSVNYLNEIWFWDSLWYEAGWGEFWMFLE